MKLVVAAAIVDDAGRLLAARRSAPAALAGRWEFPGGKREPGEDDETALRRELREELGVEAVVGERVGGAWPVPGGAVLHLYRARIAAGEPRPLQDHDELRWLEPGESWSVLWLDADRPMIEELERARTRRQQEEREEQG